MIMSPGVGESVTAATQVWPWSTISSFWNYEEDSSQQACAARTLSSDWHRLPPDLQALIICKCMGSQPAGYTKACREWRRMACEGVQSIEIAAGRSMKYHWSKVSFSSFPNLRSIVLQEHSIDKPSKFLILAIARDCPLLTHLVIEQNSGGYSKEVGYWIPPTAFATLFQMCTRLQTFKYDDRESINMPEGLGRLTALTSLFLPPSWSHNQPFPSSLSSLTQLQQLRVQEVRLYLSRYYDEEFNLPGGFFRPFQSLTLVWIQSKTLKKLPDSLMSLPVLQQLTLEEMGGLTEWPDLSHMHTLTNLVLLECASFNFKDHFADWSAFASFLPEGLRQFECRESESIYGLPGETRRCTGLQRFVLETKYVKYLHSWLCRFDCPVELVLRANWDDIELPDSIGQLSNITALHVLDLTRLKSLPDSLGSLSSLRELTVDRCDSLVELPESCVDLVSLQRVTISRCHGLRRVPFLGVQMPALSVLEVTDCPMVGVVSQPELQTDSSWWSRIFA